MEIVKLKHGELDVSLLLCNKALRLATISVTQNLGSDESIFATGSSIATSELIFSYAYFSYKMYCQKHREEVVYDEFDFDELIREVKIKREDSNLESVLEQISTSLIATVTNNVNAVHEAEKAKKKTNGKNLKPSFVEL